MRSLPGALLAAVLPAGGRSGGARQNAGASTVAEIRVEQEGQVVTDRLITGLIETRVGEPLSMRERARDDRAPDEPEPVRGRAGRTRSRCAGGVRLRYVLVPVHPVDRVEFRGTLGAVRRRPAPRV